MDINFNYVHVSASERLEQQASEKLESLHNRYDWIVRAEVFFKKENTSSDKNGMVTEIKMSVPKENLFASANERNLEAALGECVEQIKRQLQKKKEKMMTY